MLPAVMAVSDEVVVAAQGTATIPLRPTALTPPILGTGTQP